MPENLFTYVGGLIAVVLAFMLFTWLRRWGEVGPSPPVQPRPPSPAVTPVRAALRTAQAGDSTRVAITHPMIRKAAERALQQGGEVTKYVHREGDTIYFSFDALPDPEQRRRALDMLRTVQDPDAEGEAMDVMEMMTLLRRMFGK
jgi:hypothetical protein